MPLPSGNKLWWGNRYMREKERQETMVKIKTFSSYAIWCIYKFYLNPSVFPNHFLYGIVLSLSNSGEFFIFTKQRILGGGKRLTFYVLGYILLEFFFRYRSTLEWKINPKSHNRLISLSEIYVCIFIWSETVS